MSATAKMDYREKTANLQKLIGNTPMISIRYCYRGGLEQRLLAKCEHFNLTGSIKTAWRCIC